MEFNQSIYTVVEGEGVVSVTVVLVGSTDRERVVAVELSTSDINATGMRKEFPLLWQRHSV